MENKPLRTFAEMAAIIACIIAVLTYFNIYPSCSRQNDRKKTEVIADGTNNESNIEIMPEQTTSYEKEITEETYTPNEEVSSEEYQSEHRTWSDMTAWDRIMLPFIKHRKMNYHKHAMAEYGLGKTILGYVCCFGFLFIGILNLAANSVGFFDEEDRKESTSSKVSTGIIAIILLIYTILRILVQVGYY